MYFTDHAQHRITTDIGSAYDLFDLDRDLSDA